MRPEELTSLMVVANKCMWEFMFYMPAGYNNLGGSYKECANPVLKLHKFNSGEIARGRVVTLHMFSYLIVAEDVKIWLERKTEKSAMGRQNLGQMWSVDMVVEGKGVFKGKIPGGEEHLSPLIMLGPLRAFILFFIFQATNEVQLV